MTPSLLILLLSLASAGGGSQADRITGSVVDQEGGALPRAYVRLLAADGSELAETFTDTRGEFTLERGTCDGCRIEASMPGFATTRVEARTPARIALPVGPLREAVIVSATGGEAPVSQVGSAVTVFDANAIDRRGTPLVAELLRSTPGVAVVRVGGIGNVTSMFVRGGESSYNKVLLDGIPLNEPGGTFDFSNVTTESLDRVEVVRGAHSALFGTDAMASVVQLVTRRSTRTNLLGSFEAGSYNTQRGGLSGGTQRGIFDVSAHVSRFHTDNRAPNNTFRNTTLSVNGGVQLSPRVALRFVGRGEVGDSGSPGQTAFGRPDLDAFYHRTLGVGGVTMQHQRGAWQQRASYALSAIEQDSTNLLADPPYTPTFEGRTAPFEFSDFPYDSETNIDRHHASYQSEWSFTPGGTQQLLTGVLDWDGERAELTNRLAGTVVPAQRDNVGGAVQHQLLVRRVSLTSGLRVEHNDSFGTAVVPRASVVYTAREGSDRLGDTRLKASAGAGVKEPTITQSFSPSPSFLGNADLEPERARTFDAGIDQRLFGGRVKLEVVGFFGRYDNIISTRTLSFSPFRAQYFNIGLTRARGTELSVEVAPMPGLTLQAAHTYLDSEVLESTSPANAVFAVGQPLFRRPRHSGTFDIAWSRGALSAALHGTFVGERVDSDFASLVPPMVSNDAYATWDIGGGYRFGRRLTAFARVDNVSDADYMEPLGYPAWRRSARAGVKVGF
jgi:outer membrane cobalamin receptor